MYLAIYIGLAVVLAGGGWWYLEHDGFFKGKWALHKDKLIYMLAGLAAGLLLAFCFYFFNREASVLANVKALALIMLLLPIAWKDYHEMIIPNRLILAGLILRIIILPAEWLVSPGSFLTVIKSSLFACLLVALFFIMGVFVVKNGIGMGDIKLLLLMALYQGLYGMFSSVFFSLLASMAAALILLARKKKTRKDTIPFAPSVLAGTYLAVFLMVA